MTLYHAPSVARTGSISKATTIPKLPPPPRSAQKRSSLLLAVTRRLRPSAVTTRIAVMRSSARPSARPESPIPPPRAWPPTATFGHEPAGKVRPRRASRAWVGRSLPPGPITTFPPSTATVVRPPTSTTTAFLLVELPL